MLIKKQRHNPGCQACNFFHKATAGRFNLIINQCRHPENTKHIFNAVKGDQEVFSDVENFNSRGQCKLFEERDSECQ